MILKLIDQFKIGIANVESIFFTTLLDKLKFDPSLMHESTTWPKYLDTYFEPSQPNANNLYRRVFENHLGLGLPLTTFCPYLRHL